MSISESLGNLMRRPILPEDWRRFLLRRLKEALGIAILLLAMALLAAILSYDPGDPSLNLSTDRAPTNLAGYAGAIAADLLLQSIGLASLMLVLVPAVWGWQILRHRPAGIWWLRLLLLPAVVLSLAMALAAIGTSESWFLPVGFGGFAGDFLLPHAAGLAGIDPALFAIAMGLVWLGLLYLALGISIRGYVQSWRGLQAGAERAGAGLAGLAERFRQRTEPPAAAAEWRAERAREERRERLEPHLGDESAEDAEDALPREPIGVARERDGDPRTGRARRIEAPKARPKPGRRAAAIGQQTLDLVDEEYRLPPLELLTKPQSNPVQQRLSEEALEQNARLLESVLRGFRRARPDREGAAGPGGDALRARARARHQDQPRDRPRRRHRALDERGLGARRGRCPGRNVIGIELPNQHREIVMLRELLACEAYERTAAKLALVLGKDIGGAAGDRRSRAHAASLDRRHHRFRQVGRDQHHDPVAAVSADAGQMQVHHDRPEDAGTFRL